MISIDGILHVLQQFMIYVFFSYHHNTFLIKY